MTIAFGALIGCAVLWTCFLHKAVNQNSISGRFNIFTAIAISALMGMVVSAVLMIWGY